MGFHRITMETNVNNSDHINSAVLNSSMTNDYDYNYDNEFFCYLVTVSFRCSLVLAIIGFMLNLANIAVIVCSRFKQFLLTLLVSLSTSDILLDVSMIYETGMTSIFGHDNCLGTIIADQLFLLGTVSV